MESTDEVHGGVDSVQEIHQYVDVGGHVDDDEKPQTPPGDFEKLKLMSEQVSAGVVKKERAYKETTVKIEELWNECQQKDAAFSAERKACLGLEKRLATSCQTIDQLRQDAAKKTKILEKTIEESARIDQRNKQLQAELVTKENVLEEKQEKFSKLEQELTAARLMVAKQEIRLENAQVWPKRTSPNHTSVHNTITPQEWDRFENSTDSGFVDDEGNFQSLSPEDLSSVDQETSKYIQFLEEQVKNLGHSNNSISQKLAVKEQDYFQLEQAFCQLKQDVAALNDEHYQLSTDAFEVEKAAMLAEVDTERGAALLRELAKQLYGTSISLSMVDQRVKEAIEGTHLDDESDFDDIMTDHWQLDGVLGDMSDEWEAIIRESADVRGDQHDTSLPYLSSDFIEEPDTVSTASHKSTSPHLDPSSASGTTPHTHPVAESRLYSPSQSLSGSHFEVSHEDHQIITEAEQPNLPQGENPSLSQAYHQNLTEAHHLHLQALHSHLASAEHRSLTQPEHLDLQTDRPNLAKAEHSNLTQLDHSSLTQAHYSNSSQENPASLAQTNHQHLSQAHHPDPSPSQLNMGKSNRKNRAGKAASAAASAPSAANSSSASNSLSVAASASTYPALNLGTSVESLSSSPGSHFTAPASAYPALKPSTSIEIVSSPVASPITALAAGTSTGIVSASVQSFTPLSGDFTFGLSPPANPLFTLPALTSTANSPTSARVSFLEEQLRRANVKIAHLELEKAESDRVRDQHESCLATQHDQSMEIKKQKQHHEISRKLYEQKIKELDTQSKQFENLEHTVAVQEEILNKQKAHRESFEKTKNKLKAELEKSKKEAEDQAAAWRLEKCQYQARMEKAEKTNKETKKALSASQELVERTQELLAAAQTKTSKLEGENSSLKLQMQELSKKRKSLEKRVLEVEEDVEQHLMDRAQQDEKIQLLEEQLQSALNTGKHDQPLLHGRSLESELQDAVDAGSEASNPSKLELSGVTPIFTQESANGHSDNHVRPIFGLSNIISMDIAPAVEAQAAESKDIAPVVETRAAESDRPEMSVRVSRGPDQSVRVSIPFFATVAAMVISLIIFYGMTWILSPAGDGGFGVGGPTEDCSLTRLMAMRGVVFGEGNVHRGSVWS